MNFDQISKYLYSEFFVFEKTITASKLAEIIAPQFSSQFSGGQIKFTNNILQSFVHKSFRHETNLDLGHNEKLEFLGDSVLQIIVSERLFVQFPNRSEGELSKIRSAIVNESSLAELSRILGIQKFILLGKGEFKEDGFKKSSILADTFEALLGAIYLDSGIQGAQDFLNFTFENFEKQNKKPLICDSYLNSFDAKTKLQELVVKKYKLNPEYRSKEVEVAGVKQFQIDLIINGKKVETTINLSKKKGMQELAKKALEKNIIRF